MDRGEFAIALTFVTRPDCTREQAKRAMESICRRALKLSRVEHVLEAEVIGEEDHFEALGVPER